MSQLDRLISVDDHIFEPKDLWTSRVPSKHGDSIPRYVVDGDDEYWLIDGNQMRISGLSASTLPITAETMHNDPTKLAEHPAAYNDPLERVRAMDEDHVAASLGFPQVSGFGGNSFIAMRDKDAALACIEAYNDFVMEDWVGAAPGRFIGLVIVPLWDPMATVREIERNAVRGARAVTVPANPERVGLPPLTDLAHWGPILGALEASELVLCIHPGSDIPTQNIGQRKAKPPNAGILYMIEGVRRDFIVIDPAAMWVLSGVFTRHPGLRLAMSEGGITWIPQFVARLNHVWENCRIMAMREGAFDLGDDFDARQLVGRNLFGCFINDWEGLKNLDDMGEHARDGIMVEADYPHGDTPWPNSLSVALSSMDGLSDELKAKILHGNAERLFRFDPVYDPRTPASGSAAHERTNA